MKGDRYTTFGALPLHTVFRYVPDHAGLGPRVKVDAHLCCKPAWYEAHGGEPSQEALTEASWKRNSGVHFAEENMRVRVKLADNGGEHRPGGYPTNNKKFAEKVQEQLRRDDKADQFRLNMSRFATSLRKDSSAQNLLDEHQMDSMHTFEEGRNSERAAVVAFVRGARLDDFADAIERGEHRREETK